MSRTPVLPLASGSRAKSLPPLLQALLWTETMKTWDSVEYQLFPRLLAIADAAWVPWDHRAGWPQFLAAAQYHKGRLYQRGIFYYDGPYTGA